MMARRLLRPPDMNPEGLAPGEWVRKINGKSVGCVQSISGDTAVVDWLTGAKEIVQCIYLRRVPNGEGKDRRRAE